MTDDTRSLPLLAPGIDSALALACTIPEGDRRERVASVVVVVKQARSIRELEDGVVLEFDSSEATARQVWELVVAERECCAQFTYSITLEPHLGPLTLRVQASGAAIPPLRALYLGIHSEKRHGQP